MPDRAPHPCSKCGDLTANRGYCDRCTTVRKQEREAYRPSYAVLYKDPRWRRESKEFLKRNPQCVECPKRSTTVDHKVPHRGDQRLFWDQRNWQPMCKPHHDRKTARGQ